MLLVKCIKGVVGIDSINPKKALDPGKGYSILVNHIAKILIFH